jgi:hypothetical protein
MFRYLPHSISMKGSRLRRRTSYDPEEMALQFSISRRIGGIDCTNE